jgi:hypothetical protein
MWLFNVSALLLIQVSLCNIVAATVAAASNTYEMLMLVIDVPEREFLPLYITRDKALNVSADLLLQVSKYNIRGRSSKVRDTQTKHGASSKLHQSPAVLTTGKVLNVSADLLLQVPTCHNRGR